MTPITSTLTYHLSKKKDSRLTSEAEEREISSRFKLTGGDYTVAEKKKWTDEEFAKIPAVRDFNRNLKLLETLKELHSGELFGVMKLTDIAERFSAKMGETYSSLKVAEMIRNLIGGYAIERHKSRYRACINIDTLNKQLKIYEKWRV